MTRGGKAWHGFRAMAQTPRDWILSRFKMKVSQKHGGVSVAVMRNHPAGITLDEIETELKAMTREGRLQFIGGEIGRWRLRP